MVAATQHAAVKCRNSLVRGALAALWLLHGCQTTPLPPVTEVSWDQLAGLYDDGDGDSLRSALIVSQRWAEAQTPGRVFHLGARAYTAHDLAGALTQWLAALPEGASTTTLLQTLPTYFDLYQTQSEDGKLLVTGYYVPVIEGSLEQTPEYQIPVYAVPDDLISVNLDDFGPDFKVKKVRGRVNGKRLVPYWNRAQIRAGALKKAGVTPLAWVKDELDLFTVEIQGSGILQLPSGEKRVIGYADENGQPYLPIGKLLLDEKKISRDHMSMPAIRNFLVSHPGDVDRVLAYNKSFVFFHFTEGEIIGNLGAPLTAQRSMAADQRVIPPALPVFLSAPRPALEKNGVVSANGTISRFMFIQDTGGAIRGPGHVDFFWGQGHEAGAMAGITRQQGALFVLIPRARP